MPDERVLFPCARGTNRRRIGSPYSGTWQRCPSAWADMNEYYGEEDHFITYRAADWTVTEVGDGSGTQALTDALGGELLLTNSALDNDSIEIQKLGEAYRCANSNQLWYEAKFQVSEATESDFLVGLCITDTTLIVSNPTDGIFFSKDDGAVALNFEIRKDGTSTAVDTGVDVSAASWIRAGFYFDGTRVHYFVDGTELGALGGANLPDDEDLCVSFANQNGDGNARTMTIDYYKVVQES